jgi:class 3 adenylate cyclase/putative methionine-R-sulfoxide reductase with GAF domain
MDNETLISNLKALVEHQEKVINALRDVSSKVNTKLDLDTIFKVTFQLLDDFFNLKHILILLSAEDGLTLKVCASHGYNGEGIGSVVPVGVGVIGIVAKNKKLMRMGNVAAYSRYLSSGSPNAGIVPLPGLPHARSQLGVPLLMNQQLVGVLYVESTTAAVFDKKEEFLLQVIGVQIAIAINNAKQYKLLEEANNSLHYLNENLEQKVTERTAQLVAEKAEMEKQKQRSEELLLNILPEEVAEELKANGSTEAKLINQVTVIFTDFKYFTNIAEQLSPGALVAQIHECFSAFDLIMEKYGVEKIKTIGDAYMAAGGLPTPNKTNAHDVVNAALAMNRYMHEHKRKKEAAGELFFEMRIGIHTGPVVAGVVGVKKFAYDVWGDTVNIASRMESCGVIGKVNISETTYALVKENFNCIYRGEIEAKNKGKMKMYFVE